MESLDYNNSLQPAHDPQGEQQLNSGFNPNPSVGDSTGKTQASIPTQVVSSKQSTSPLGMLPPLAEDADLIEDEWIEIVKTTIEGNKLDPYSQTKAMTELRADYLKKRYGKNIKVSEN